MIEKCYKMINNLACITDVKHVGDNIIIEPVVHDKNKHLYDINVYTMSRDYFCKKPMCYTLSFIKGVLLCVKSCVFNKKPKKIEPSDLLSIKELQPLYKIFT